MTSLRSGVSIEKMIKCIIHRIKNLFSFSESVGRLDYTVTFFALITFGFGFVILILYFFEMINTNFNIGVSIIYITAFVANVSRRVNHLGNHPATTLLIFVPIVQLIFIFYLHFLPGKDK